MLRTRVTILRFKPFSLITKLSYEEMHVVMTCVVVKSMSYDYSTNCKIDTPVNPTGSLTQS